MAETEAYVNLIAALVSMATLVLGYLLYQARVNGKVSNDQGDIAFAALKAVYALAKGILGNDPKYADKIRKAGAIIDELNRIWDDSKAPTPEMKAKYEQLTAILKEIYPAGF